MRFHLPLEVFGSALEIALLGDGGHEGLVLGDTLELGEDLEPLRDVVLVLLLPRDNCPLITREGVLLEELSWKENNVNRSQ